jgi:hypothetical protein
MGRAAPVCFKQKLENPTIPPSEQAFGIVFKISTDLLGVVLYWLAMFQHIPVRGGGKIRAKVEKMLGRST